MAALVEEMVGREEDKLHRVVRCFYQIDIFNGDSPPITLIIPGLQGNSSRSC